MKHVILLIIVLSISYCSTVKGADWKYISSTKGGGKTVIAFYDRLSKVKKGGRYISVWVKLFSQEKIDNVHNTHKDTIDALSKKIFSPLYFPPSVLILEPDITKRLQMANIVIAMEVEVNLFSMSPQLSPIENAHLLIDCDEHKIQTLSYYLYDDEGEVTQIVNEASGWDDMAPDTFGYILQQILCNY